MDSASSQRSRLSRFVGFVLRPGEPTPLQDTALRRAREDTVAVVNSRGVAFGFVLAVTVPTLASLIVVGSHHKWLTIVLAGIGTAVLGFAVAVALVLSWQLIRAPYRQRKEARNEIDVVRSELTAEIGAVRSELAASQEEIEALKNPPVTLRLGDQLRHVSRVIPGDSIGELVQAQAGGGNVTQITDFWATVTNASAVDVDGVRARVMSTDAPSLHDDLPNDLHWSGKGTATRREISADDHAHAVVATRVELDNGYIGWSGPLAGALFPLRGTMHVNIEVWWNGRRMDGKTYPFTQVVLPHPPAAPETAPQANRAARRAAEKRGGKQS